MNIIKPRCYLLVLLLIIFNQLFSQYKEVRGRVIDENREVVIGAAIFLEDKSIGVSSDVDGNFSIRIPEEESKLVVSYIGYETQTVQISENMLVVLKTNSQELEGVVVTGIFKKAKESYTGSVATIDKEDLRINRGQNMLQTLRNADISINLPMNNLMGSNPNNIPELNIRGSSSLPTNLKEFNEGVKYTSNTPLIIMDGFEISLTRLMDFNDDEIESINILKDASATAIYGSRGANGVIVVVSKTPQTGKISVSAELGMNLEVPDLSSYDLLNAAEKLELERSIGIYDRPGIPSMELGDYQESYYRKLRNVLSGVDTDWIRKPVRVGIGSSYKLRLDGGDNNFRWGVSLLYRDIEGAMKESYRRTFNGGATLMYTLDNLTFRNYTTVGSTKSQESKYGNFADYVSQQPYNNPYDEFGEVRRTMEGLYLGSGELYNPLYDSTLGSFNKSGSQDVINNFSIEWNIIDNLILRGQYGVSSIQHDSDLFLSSESYKYTREVYVTNEGFLRKGEYSYGTGKSFDQNLSATLSYNRIFNEKHNLYTGANWELAEYNSHSYLFRVEGFPNDEISFLPNALQYEKDGKPSGSKTKSRRLGVTGNLNYSYLSRYYLDLSYRVDGNSNFGSEKKYAPFWSVGAGWSLHNESFMKDIDFVNYLRLKLSYGQTGRMDTSLSGAHTTYRYVTDNRYMSWVGAQLIGLGNEKLTWQKTDQFNLGAEVYLFDNIVKFDFDLYNKKTSNLLSYMDLPASVGFSSYLANVGSVINKGFETSLSVFLFRGKKTKDFTWVVSGQFTYNKNEITKLSDAIKAQNEEYLRSDARPEMAQLLFEGKPQDAIYAVTSLGINPATGEEVFLDKNGNPTRLWTKGEFVYQGEGVPKYRGLGSSMFQWNGFTLNVAVSFHGGGKLYNATLPDRVELSKTEIAGTNVDRRVFEERWAKPGDVAKYKKISNSWTRASSRFVMDDRQLTIQSLNLDYRWDSDWLKAKTGIQSATFGFNMSDIYTFSTIKMERGINYPYARNIQGSIKLFF